MIQTGFRISANHLGENKGKIPKMADQNNLVSYSVVGELPAFDATVQSGELIRNVTIWLDRVPDLPGIIIKSKRGSVLLSRQRLHEWLSRPFGTELFLNRPISFLLSTTTLPDLIVPAETRIDEAVQIVLDRPTTEIYEPVIVLNADGHMRVLDFHVLLLAQTQLLARANQFISQQVESGQALSQIMELPDVLHHILQYLSSLVSFDQGTLLIVDPEMQDHLRQEIRVSMPKTGHVGDIIFDRKAVEYLSHARQPLLISDVGAGIEWLESTTYQNVLSWIGFPLVYSDKVICLISLIRLRNENTEGPFGRNDLDLIASLSTTFTAAIRNAHLHAELRSLAITDPLTGTLNRRGFFDIALKVYERQISSGSPCSVLILDIDFFKRINDTYGHRVGDLVIREVAAECHRQLRDVDLLGRYGGEEFVALLPGANLSGAQIVAERLRDSIAHLPVQTGRGTTNVTVSIGIAETQDGTLSLEALIQHADEVMYQAKSLGRNRFESWEEHSILATFPEIKQMEWHSGPVLSIQSRSFEPLDRLEAFKVSSSRFIEAIETESILGWVRALELRENEEERHAQDGADITIQLCRHMGFKESELIHIYRGAMLHDVGKLAIPDHIHNKAGPLGENEWEIMRKHVEFGYQMLLPVAFLHPALAIPYCHHEKWDGSGYPRHLKGLEIPLEARLFALVDVWQALRSNRCYRPAWAEDRIVEYIHSQSGNHFDPNLIEIFQKIVLKN